MWWLMFKFELDKLCVGPLVEIYQVIDQWHVRTVRVPQVSNKPQQSGYLPPGVSGHCQGRLGL